MPQADFGLMLQPRPLNFPGKDLFAYNRRLIRAAPPGFTTLWAEDHLQWGEQPTIECFTTLAYFAAEFPQYHVGSLVLCQAYRNPALLAKMAANLQAMSGGRFILGLGAGWREEEYRSYGYAFSNPRERIEQLEEAAAIIKAMWTSRPAAYTGKYFRVEDAWCEPQPDPPIPLLIGAGGEQRALRVVACHADWYNFNSCTVEQYAHKIAVLKEHCRIIGRDPAAIKLTYLGTASVSEDPAKVYRTPDKHIVAGSPAAVIRELAQFCELGVSHFIFRFRDIEALEYFGEKVAPHFT